MLFIEPRFLAFFAVVLTVYWLLPGNRGRKLWLLGASYVFYAAWDWRFVFQMMAISGIDWWVGVKLGETDDPRRRHRLVLLALVTNLGNLFFFKYFNFFADSLVRLLDLLGAEASWTTLHIILPVGISFYTFQMLSYVLDVYRGDLAPRKSLLDIALLAALFPQLVAGPILRAGGFLPQLDSERDPTSVPVRTCLAMFLIGYFKKACVSDNISPFIDPVFAEPMLYSADALIGATLLYAAQIYCDFSGYTDMALASSGLLGYHLPQNFNWPYLASNISDFWRRWHISLSTWLRDYLYIPLGGNRHGALMRYRNLMLTMVLGGLWHGASWNFVVWGTLHGLALSVHHLFRDLLWPRIGLGEVGRPLGLLGRLAATAFTFWLVCLAWIFFRAQDLSDALLILHAYITLHGPGTAELGIPYKPLLLVLGVMHWLAWRFRPELAVARLPPVAFATAYGATAALVLAFLPGEYRPFVYFQF
jgi:alginate O-acetyltransferase complex protein AlgI